MNLLKKTIDGVLTNIAERHGSLRGITGNAVVCVKALELFFNDKEETK